MEIQDLRLSLRNETSTGHDYMLTDYYMINRFNG